MEGNGSTHSYAFCANFVDQQAAILYNLKARHSRGIPYTRTGDIVIAVNPYQVSWKRSHVWDVLSRMLLYMYAQIITSFKFSF